MNVRTGPTRRTHAAWPDHGRGLVVFHIGMRINQPWRPDLWGPVAAAMPRMLRELTTDPQSGLLGWRLVADPRGPWTVQYWQSIEKLYAYASNPQAEHRPAWSAFNRRARAHPRAVGVWHETFEVARAESIYVGMDPTGFGRITPSVEVQPETDRAAQRLGR